MSNRILVTGGCGFIGSAFIRLALLRGYKILNVDNLTYAANTDSIPSELQSNENYSHAKLDISARDEIAEAVYSFAPDKVINFAAETHVDNSISDPSVFITTNIIGTYTLLDVLRGYWEVNERPKNFRFHHISTDEVYGSLNFESNSLFNEESLYQPNSPYSASKASSDHLVRAWYKTYELPTILTNCSNNYGPFQNAEKLVPKTIKNAFEGSRIPIYGNGLNVRDWLFVDDHAAALLQILLSAKPGSHYNIGGDCELSNLDLVKLICDTIDEQIKPSRQSFKHLVEFVPDRAGHDLRYAVDHTKLTIDLGWEPKTKINSGIKQTIEWFVTHNKV